MDYRQWNLTWHVNAVEKLTADSICIFQQLSDGHVLRYLPMRFVQHAATSRTTDEFTRTGAVSASVQKSRTWNFHRKTETTFSRKRRLRREAEKQLDAEEKERSGEKAKKGCLWSPALLSC